MILKEKHFLIFNEREHYIVLIIYILIAIYRSTDHYE
jgi:hypothetical protein